MNLKKPTTLVVATALTVFSFVLLSNDAYSQEAPGDVDCCCGRFWGKGCKADNYGADCNPQGTSDCDTYASNCSS